MRDRDEDQERFDREVAQSQGSKIATLEQDVARLTAEIQLLYRKLQTVRDELHELRRARQ